MLDKIKAKISGYGTYITVWIGVALAGVGLLFGGVDLGTVHIPAVDPKEFIEIVFAAIAATRLRMGVKKAENAAKPETK